MADPLPLLAETLDGLFQARVERSGNDIAYRQFDLATGSWRDFSWEETRAQADRWLNALRRAGMRLGDRVALQLRNSVEWVCFDQAALSLGLVVVPLYLDNAPATTRHILKDCGARLLLVVKAADWDALRSDDPDELRDVEKVVCLEGAKETGDGRVRAVADWLAERSAPAAPEPRRTSADLLATIVYTSGTTGTPKGAMLSHRP